MIEDKIVEQKAQDPEGLHGAQKMRPVEIRKIEDKEYIVHKVTE